MKRLYCGWLFVVGLAGCRTVPEPLPPPPSVAMSRASGVPVAKLQSGRAVYVSNCTRCHEPMMPKEIATNDWHVVVPGMAWNAGISEEQEDAVLAYILAVKVMPPEPSVAE